MRRITWTNDRVSVILKLRHASTRCRHITTNLIQVFNHSKELSEPSHLLSAFAAEAQLVREIDLALTAYSKFLDIWPPWNLKPTKMFWGLYILNLRV